MRAARAGVLGCWRLGRCLGCRPTRGRLQSELSLDQFVLEVQHSREIDQLKIGILSPDSSTEIAVQKPRVNKLHNGRVAQKIN